MEKKGNLKRLELLNSVRNRLDKRIQDIKRDEATGFCLEPKKRDSLLRRRLILMSRFELPNL